MVGVEDVGAVALVRDTCNVWVLRAGREAIVVDVGSGLVFDRLPELGVDRVTDVLVTHHHRDSLQGLERAAAHGARVWVPPLERGLVEGADEHWRTRQLGDDYDVRQDRFSLLHSVPVAGEVAEYRTRRYGAFDVFTLPTPGHTTGSETYLVELGGKRVAFTGDLLYGPGRVWSLAATQWSYSGMEGQMATAVSCALVADREPDLLLPAHGESISEPRAALELTAARLQELVNLRRREPIDIAAWRREPWAIVSPHLLRNRTSFANSYALLSDSGSALLIDFGFDGITGVLPYTDRQARRPLLFSLDALRRDFGVERIEAVVVTHYHDDHVAGINLLRDVEGVEAWVPENVAPILADPLRHDLPCLWWEPVPADRVLPLRELVRWREYELTPYALPGHTMYAAAIAFECDGRRVLATGDQQALDGPPEGPDVLNYQYRNRYRIDDFVASAELYRALRPELLLGGHWLPKEVSQAWLDRMLADGRRLAELHRELLPLDEVDFGAEGFGARIEPYRSRVAPGGTVELDVTVLNPFGREATATVAAVVPAGWSAEPATQEVELAAHEERTVRIALTVSAEPVLRERVAVDLTVDGVRFGQQAEALVDVVA